MKNTRVFCLLVFGLVALLLATSGATCARRGGPGPELDLEVALNQAGQILVKAEDVGAPEIDPYNFRCAELYLSMAQEQFDKHNRERALGLARQSIEHGELALRHASAYHPSEQ